MAPKAGLLFGYGLAIELPWEYDRWMASGHCDHLFGIRLLDLEFEDLLVLPTETVRSRACLQCLQL